MYDPANGLLASNRNAALEPANPGEQIDLEQLTKEFELRSSSRFKNRDQAIIFVDPDESRARIFASQRPMVLGGAFSADSLSLDKFILKANSHIIEATTFNGHDSWRISFQLEDTSYTVVTCPKLDWGPVFVEIKPCGNERSNSNIVRLTRIKISDIGENWESLNGQMDSHVDLKSGQKVRKRSIFRMIDVRPKIGQAIDFSRLNLAEETSITLANDPQLTAVWKGGKIQKSFDQERIKQIGNLPPIAATTQEPAHFIANWPIGFCLIVGLAIFIAFAVRAHHAKRK